MWLGVGGDSVVRGVGGDSVDHWVQRCGLWVILGGDWERRSVVRLLLSSDLGK